MIDGALMALNPPPHDVRKAAALPFIGWVTMAFGVYIAIKVLYPPDIADTGNPPRHASGEEHSVRDSVKVVSRHGVPRAVASPSGMASIGAVVARRHGNRHPGPGAGRDTAGT
ncbi:hypothetical protein MMAN_45590 [Mycobacterium mantenii]|nr:hypothetical protein MMAN_45590 [Mycobacterium mantenii]